LFTEALAETGGRLPERGWFPIISSDRVDRGVGNLGSPLVQAEVECWLDGVELLILDNLSSLTVGVRENDGDAWAQIQDWLLRLRRRGISVLIIHHTGKHGGQRGTSRREDVLDTSFSLRQPSDYTIDQGARFEVHIEKGRGLHGDHAKPFEAQLEERPFLTGRIGLADFCLYGQLYYFAFTGELKIPAEMKNLIAFFGRVDRISSRLAPDG